MYFDLYKLYHVKRIKSTNKVKITIDILFRCDIIDSRKEEGGERMKKFILDLLDNDAISVVELENSIREVRYSDDKEIYSNLTVEDMNLADEVLDYISNAKDIDFIKQRMNGH